MKKTLLIIIVLNVGLGLLQLGLSAGRATDGATLAKVERQAAVLQLDNTRLQDQIYKLSALPSIQSRAEALQLVPVTPAYLSVEAPVAQAR